LSGGGVGGADDEGREDMEWVGDGVGGVDENIALAGAKWTRLIVAVGSELLKLNIDMYVYKIFPSVDVLFEPNGGIEDVQLRIVMY
jgi:hypothetical protein